MALDGSGRDAPFATPSRETEPTLSESLRRALRVIEDRPGCRINDLAETLGVAHATATFQMQALRRRGLIHDMRDGRDRRLFPTSHLTAFSYLAALRRDERKDRIVRFLLEGGMQGLTLNKAARRLDIPFGYLKRTLHQLELAGLIALQRRNYRYTIHTSATLLALAEPQVKSDMEPDPASDWRTRFVMARLDDAPQDRAEPSSRL